MNVEYLIVGVFSLMINMELNLSETKNETLVEICCKCVEFYFCVNGTINKRTAGTHDPNIGFIPSSELVTEPPIVNVKLCPRSIDFCCRPPDADPSCLDELNDHNLTTTDASTFYNTPDPNSNCICVGYNLCPSESIVSDDLGNTSILLENGRLVNHSQCHHALEVCCLLPNLDLPSLNTTEIFSTHTLLPSNHTIKEEKCECVERHLCGADEHFETFGGGVLKVDPSTSKSPEPCPSNSKLVCCFPQNIIQVIYTTATNVLPTMAKTTHTLNHFECGHRNADGVGARILGFKNGETQFGEFPWVVILIEKEIIMERESPIYVGGASLIHPRVVMTAAHLLRDRNSEGLFARLGEWDTDAVKEVFPHQEVAIQEIIIHEEYNPEYPFNDVALLILQEEAKLDQHISPICIGKGRRFVDRYSCVITSWGSTVFRKGRHQNILRSAKVPLIKRKKCWSSIKKSPIRKLVGLLNSYICTGENNEEITPLLGDEGSALSCPLIDNPLRYVQIGIAPKNIEWKRLNLSGMFVKVPHFYEWIEENIESRFPGFKSLNNFTTAEKTSFTTEELEEINEQKIMKRNEKKAAKRKMKEEKKRRRTERKEVRMKNKEEKKKKKAERKAARRKIKAENKREMEIMEFSGIGEEEGEEEEEEEAEEEEKEEFRK